ncbi:hypothetical protein ACU5AY_09095 [Rhizobium sp. PAMB 3174]
MIEKPEKHTDGCPLEPVHKRLEDLHHQWHLAQNAYFDPEAFRMAIQTAIQTSRTVSFILQNNKRVIPDFDNWYMKWQNEFRSIPLMKWMVDARNKIEKQGDLEAHSFIRAEIVASHLNEGPVVQVPAELFDAPWKLVKSIPDSELGNHIKKDGVLRIQRRWIENTLPDFELLDAVAIAYGHLSRLLDDAHRQIGLPVPEHRNVETGELYDAEAMQGRLPCMIGHGDLRSLDVWLANGTAVEFDRIERKIDREDLIAQADRFTERYGLEPKDIFGGSDSAEATLDALFKTARVMLEKDGGHITIMFYFKGKAMLHMTELRPAEHGQKYLMMRNAAHDLVRKGADTVILIGEVWSAPYSPSNPYRRAVDAPEREEWLVANLVRKTGEPIQLSARMVRKEGRITLDATQEQRGGAHFLFAPFYEAWGREIPTEWMEQEKATRGMDHFG